MSKARSTDGFRLNVAGCETGASIRAPGREAKIIFGPEVKIHIHPLYRFCTSVACTEAGHGFEVRDVAVFDIPEDKVTITTVRHWLWTADDKSLLIEMMRTAPNGTISSKRTFVRK